jgi:hypothetical protein
LAAYCAALDIPERGEDFAAALKRELIAAAAAVDAGFAVNPELSIDPDGTPHLKQLATTERAEGLAEFCVRTGELRGKEQGSRTKALSRSLQRRSSIAAPVRRVLGPLGCHP